MHDAKLHQFIGQMLDAARIALVRISDTLCLYKLHERGPMTVTELAATAGVSERYLREWLSHQAASNYLSYDSATQKFALPPEQAVFAIEDSPVNVASGDVKRAIDYMEANLTSPIGLADITAAAGVPARTLLEHFKRYRRVSPIGYLRGARFARVREALRYAGPEENVTGIAMSLGFTHMGRFSVEYRKRFGESPSETLKQRRGVPLATGTPVVVRSPAHTETRSRSVEPERPWAGSPFEARTGTENFHTHCLERTARRGSRPNTDYWETRHLPVTGSSFDRGPSGA